MLPTTMARATDAQIEAALNDKTRPRRDRARDGRDRAADVLRFIDIGPGDRVVDFLPYRGYFTRLCASLVGDHGRVFAAIPTELTKIERIEAGRSEVEQFARERHNIVLLKGSAEKAGAPTEQIDVLCIVQNYHDLHTPMMGPVDVHAFNNAVFRVLKPGGHYVIVDHRAQSGTSTEAAKTLHRIDPAVVRREVEAVGFEDAGELDVLRSRCDPRTSSIFARGIRYHTDRFIVKFRKPAALMCRVRQ
ncbi:methyltransferase domain-containing protein [Paraburkholderia sp. CI3]|uniref:methyltransferase domain-containing protein n=1 Tax=Paraburkholderia sp. CI3 TaxID=2991060 RepID=UPI003D201B0C